MTMGELSEYSKLRRRLARDEQALESLRAASHPGAQVITGAPHATGVSDSVGNLAADIVDAEEQLRKLREKCSLAKDRAAAYIGAIDDGQMRMVFRLRFLRCLTWTKVAAIIGGKNTSDSVRMMCQRYLAANKE